MLHRSSLDSLPDDALLQSLKAVAARSNQITAVLLQQFSWSRSTPSWVSWCVPFRGECPSWSPSAP
jgi:hypothetical protein